MNPWIRIWRFHSRIQDPSLKPLQPLYVDIWASLHVNMKAETI